MILLYIITYFLLFITNVLLVTYNSNGYKSMEVWCSKKTHPAADDGPLSNYSELLIISLLVLDAY